MVYFFHFSKKGFWDDYYKKNGVGDHEWLQDYSELKDIYRMISYDEKDRSKEMILDIGCGTSTILENMYKNGYNNLVGIDFSQLPIQKMNEKYSNMKENFQFFQMNALETDFIDSNFDKIIDKCLLDCILVS